jgi:hypothetical protein
VAQFSGIDAKQYTGGVVLFVVLDWWPDAEALRRAEQEQQKTKVKRSIPCHLFISPCNEVLRHIKGTSIKFHLRSRRGHSLAVSADDTAHNSLGRTIQVLRFWTCCSVCH